MGPRRGLGWALGLLFAVPFSAAQAQAPEVTVKVGGRAQVQYSTTSLGEEELGADAPASNTFELRRLRLRLDLTFGDWVTARIQPDFAQGDLKVADAWINFALSDYLDFKVGQFNRSFSRLQLTSSTVFPTIERGVRIAGLDDYLGGVPGEEYELLAESGYASRDIGAALRGGTERFGWEVGVFNGQGADERDVNDGKSVATRVTVGPFAAAPLQLGVGAVRRDLTDEDAWAYEADAEWGEFRSPGLHMLAEAMFGDNLASAPGARFTGVQGILSWFTPLGGPRFDGLELVGRASWGDPDNDVDEDDGVLLTPGLSLYVFGRNRLMANWDVYLPAAEALDTQQSFRAQAQVYF